MMMVLVCVPLASGVCFSISFCFYFWLSLWPCAGTSRPFGSILALVCFTPPSQGWWLMTLKSTHSGKTLQPAKLFIHSLSLSIYLCCTVFAHKHISVHKHCVRFGNMYSCRQTLYLSTHTHPSLLSPAAISYDRSINRLIYEQGMPARCVVMIPDTLCTCMGEIESMMNVGWRP